MGIIDFDITTGFVQHVSFRGRASVGAWDQKLADRILAKYLGEDKSTWDNRRFITGFEDNEHWAFVKFKPQTALIRDQSYRV